MMAIGVKRLAICKAVVFSLILNVGALSSARTYDAAIATRKCEQFSDTRVNTKENGTLLVIPKHVTHRRKEDLYLKMTIGEYGEHTEEKCRNHLDLTIGLQERSLHPGVEDKSTDKFKLKDAWQSAAQNYFTDDGYFYRQMEFLSPTDYCVKAVSDTKLIIKTCETDCSGDLSTTYLYTPTPASDGFGTSRVCLPKCCGLDEALSVTDFSCRVLNSTEPTYFLPYLHLRDPIYFRKESGDAEEFKDKILVAPKNLREGRRLFLNTSHVIGTPSKSIWQRLHFYTRRMMCSRFQWQGFYYDDVENWGRNRKNRYNFRVAADKEEVKLEFLTNSRKWRPTQKSFCVDGLDGWYPNGTERAVVSIVVMCAEANMLDQRDTSGQAGFRFEDHEETHVSPLKIVYLVISFLCMVFLFWGFSMYHFLSRQLNVFGKVIAYHLGSVALSYFISWVAAIMSMTGYLRHGSNAVVIVSIDFDGYRRVGWACAVSGVLAHYAYLSSFFWLSCLNSDAWDKLKGWARNIWVYSILGWGVPALLVAIFCIVDIYYNDPWGKDVVPDYGVESCYVASWSSLYYVQIPVAIILLLNCALILVNSCQFWWKKRSLLRMEDSTGNWNAEGLPFRLFVIIWLAQIFNWLITFTEWYRVSHGQEENWARTTLLCLGSVMETWILVHVYCLNGVVLKVVAERITFLRPMANYLLGKRLFTSVLVAKAFEGGEESHNDRVIVPNEQISRM